MEASLFTGTQPLDPGHRIDMPALQTYLRARLPGTDGTMTIERFRGGQSNPTMVLSFDGIRRYVLRKKPDGVLLPSAHAVDREYRVTLALAGGPVPVARPRLLCEDSSLAGAMFYMMDYVEGRAFWDPSLPGMEATERTAIYREMNRVIAALHSVDLATAGLSDFGKSGDYVARQVARWTRQYRASETQRIPAMEHLIAWLPEHLPPARGSALIHGDYRLDNLILHPSEPRILAVVDWELSTLGDPVADFAYHTLTWHLASTPFRGLADRDLVGLGIPGAAAYRTQYLAATGQPEVPEHDWNAYLAFGLFRIAAIRQGIMKRVGDGNASNSNARAAGELAGAVAGLGWAYALKAMQR